MKKFIIALLLILPLFPLFAETTTIGVGSCNHHYDPQDYWAQVKKQNLETWIWLGDIIYANEVTPEERRAIYQRQKSNPFYADFIKGVEILGVWDDHDYAFNNAGSEFKYAKESKAALLEFLGYPKSESIYNRKGIYHSRLLADGKIEVVLLDGRSFLNKEKGIFLGEEQWAWLEETLEQSQAQLILLGSPVAVLSDISLNNRGLEGWNYFKEQRERLYKLIERTEVPLMLLSGDRHFSELTRIKLGNKRLYEFMSSGLTHTTPVSIPSRKRVGRAVTKKNFGVLKVHWKKGKLSDVEVRIHAAKDSRKLYSRRIDLKKKCQSPSASSHSPCK